MKLKVELNGTVLNPFEQMGLTQNPFPQIADARYSAACLRLQSLAGKPIPHANAEEYIRTILTGFTKEFVDMCVAKFEPGKRVRFTVEFNDKEG